MPWCFKSTSAPHRSHEHWHSNTYIMHQIRTFKPAYRMTLTATHATASGASRVAQSQPDSRDSKHIQEFENKNDPQEDQAFEARSDLAERIKRSINYMHQHLNASVSVSTMACQAGISQSHFFALFKQSTGLSPIDFFIRLRMERACELLESTMLSVKEVATALGYDDPFYFSRVFKVVNSMPPRDYRRNTHRHDHAHYGQNRSTKTPAPRWQYTNGNEKPSASADLEAEAESPALCPSEIRRAI